ncbi:phosphoribosylamine--glycine ligase [Treponema pectinovorum]|uniref:phosphoribosylamine--glycine ligase n=1 Tax=Treponema pectinovorum TaxID=164 RepID=UPI0011CA8A74|nr:phosphoribosylamine--glycine ligase [Treponema pectinovorum]
MKVMVIGSGGREHTIAWKLAQSDKIDEVICVPGNGGTSKEAKCKNENGDAVEIATREKIDFAVVGPEDPLADGIADRLWSAGIKTVGPKAKGAALEASKDLSKEFMKKYGVHCASSETFTNKDDALAYIQKKGAPIVVKADGLAAGKGVVVAKTVEEAKKAATDMMEGEFGEAGKKLVIEDYLQGVEISVLAAVSVSEEIAKQNKACIKAFLPARDHKRLLDGAKGPNTGGMGAVCPLADVSEDTMLAFEKNILQPTLRGLIEEKMDYRGFIFFGLMLTKEGPKALEYNVRLGDPETQAVLPMMDFDFSELCLAIMDGTLCDFKMNWKDGFQVAPVAVSGGYPLQYSKGKLITLDNKKIDAIGAKVFFAGASANEDGKIVTSGGRVLACSAHGKSFEDAWKKAYSALECINYDGMFYRKDIGLPGAAESN